MSKNNFRMDLTNKCSSRELLKLDDKNLIILANNPNFCVVLPKTWMGRKAQPCVVLGSDWEIKVDPLAFKKLRRKDNNIMNWASIVELGELILASDDWHLVCETQNGKVFVRLSDMEYIDDPQWEGVIGIWNRWTIVRRDESGEQMLYERKASPLDV